MEKGEHAGNQHFLLHPHCFKIVYAAVSVYEKLQENSTYPESILSGQGLVP